MRQRSTVPAPITKHHQNHDSAIFISEVVAITPPSSSYPRIRKQCKSNQLVSSIIHLLPNKCKIHGTELKPNYYFLLRPWYARDHGRLEIFLSQPKKFCIVWALNIHNTYQLNAPALFLDAKTWRRQLHDEPLPRISVDSLFCDHDGHSHLWTIMTDCDHYKWPIPKLFATIRDHV